MGCLSLVYKTELLLCNEKSVHGVEQGDSGPMGWTQFGGLLAIFMVASDGRDDQETAEEQQPTTKRSWGQVGSQSRQEGRLVPLGWLQMASEHASGSRSCMKASLMGVPAVLAEAGGFPAPAACKQLERGIEHQHGSITSSTF